MNEVPRPYDKSVLVSGIVTAMSSPPEPQVISEPQSVRVILDKSVPALIFSENITNPLSVGPTPQVDEYDALGVDAYTTFGARVSLPEAAFTEMDQELFVLMGAAGLPKTSFTTPVNEVVT
jgi:hypothetical protein